MPCSRALWASFPAAAALTAGCSHSTASAACYSVYICKFLTASFVIRTVSISTSGILHPTYIHIHSQEKRSSIKRNCLINLPLLLSNLLLTIMEFPRYVNQQASEQVMLMLAGCCDLASWEPLFPTFLWIIS